MFKTTKFKALIISLVMMLFSTSIVGAATIYATGYCGNAIITIDTDTGASEFVGPTIGFPWTYAAAFTPDGTLWGIADRYGCVTPKLVTFDLSTGAVTPVADMSFWSLSLVSDSAGTLYTENDNKLYTINKANGQETLVGSLGFSALMDMAFDNSGTLWAVATPRDYFTTNLYTIDTATGAGTLVCPSIISDCGGELMTLAVDPATDKMYATPHDSPAFLYEVDTDSCTLTQIGDALSQPLPHGGAIQPLDSGGFKNQGDCISSLKKEMCSGLKGKDRAKCNKEVQYRCREDY
jgi:hypothetical protein